MKQEVIRKKEEYIKRRLKLGLADDYMEANAEVEAKKELIKIEQSNEAAAKRQAEVAKEISRKKIEEMKIAGQEQIMQLKMNKYNE